MASVMATAKAKTRTKAVRKAVVRPKRGKKPTVTYIRDDQGNPVAVVVPITFFEELVELADQREDIVHLLRNRKVPGEPIPLEELTARLRAEGKLR